VRNWQVCARRILRVIPNRGQNLNDLRLGDLPFSNPDSDTNTTMDEMIKIGDRTLGIDQQGAYGSFVDDSEFEPPEPIEPMPPPPPGMTDEPDQQ
jgi:hypothetical protein